MDQYTATSCEATARNCMAIFQGIATGDYSDQWIKRHLVSVESDLAELIEEVQAALNEEDNDDDE